MSNQINIGQGSTFVDEGDGISDASWNGPNGTAVRYSMAVLWDAIADGSIYAAQVGNPSLAPYDALPYAGQDRLIVQGYQESVASYQQRLTQFLDRWPYSGKASGVMLAVYGWLMQAGLTNASMAAIAQGSWDLPQMRVVTSNSRWWTYNTGTNPMPPFQTDIEAGYYPMVFPSLFKGNPLGEGDWNWDSETTQWARSWLIIYATTTGWATGNRTWGEAQVFWGDGNGWGFDQPYEIFSGIPAVIKHWKAEHAWYVCVIVSLNSTNFNPFSGVTNPQGNWQYWYTILSNNYIQCRFTSARYVDGAM